jgi:hypothetical protein
VGDVHFVYIAVAMTHPQKKKHLFVETKHLFVGTKHLFVGTQDLCVQSNKTGSNKTIPIRMIRLDGTLDWTGRKDLASLQTILSVTSET